MIKWISSKHSWIIFQSESSDEITYFLFLAFAFFFAFKSCFSLKNFFNLIRQKPFNLPCVYFNYRVIFVDFRRRFCWGKIFAQKNIPEVDVEIFELLIVHFINFWELILQYFSPCIFESYPIFEQILRLKCYFELYYDTSAYRNEFFEKTSFFVWICDFLFFFVHAFSQISLLNFCFINMRLNRIKRQTFCSFREFISITIRSNFSSFQSLLSHPLFHSIMLI